MKKIALSGGQGRSLASPAIGRRRGDRHSPWQTGRCAHRFQVGGRLVRVPAGVRSALLGAHRVGAPELARQTGCSSGGDLRVTGAVRGRRWRWVRPATSPSPAPPAASIPETASSSRPRMGRSPRRPGPSPCPGKARDRCRIHYGRAVRETAVARPGRPALPRRERAWRMGRDLGSADRRSSATGTGRCRRVSWRTAGPCWVRAGFPPSCWR